MNPGFQAFITYVPFSSVDAGGIINGPLKLMMSITGTLYLKVKLVLKPVDSFWNQTLDL